MSTIYLITGGARSGKSSYAQQLCEFMSSSPVYLATAPQSEDDADFQQRIQKHQQDRGEQWTTIEEPLYPSQFHAVDENGNVSDVGRFRGKVVLIDCLMREGTACVASRIDLELDSVLHATEPKLSFVGL